MLGGLKRDEGFSTMKIIKEKKLLSRQKKTLLISQTERNQNVLVWFHSVHFQFLIDRTHRVKVFRNLT
jgi:hypothetical protein